MNRSRRQDVAMIYLVIGFSSLLLVVGCYLFGMRPLIGYLRDSHTQSIELALQNSVGRLQTILHDHKNLARQTASRTAIRLKQAAYLRGDIMHDALVAFSQPKLADALNANEDLMAIVRYDPPGARLYAVGKPVSPQLDQLCQQQALNDVKISTMILEQGSHQLVYCSPILDHQQGHLGVDLLLINDQAIQALIDEQSQPPDTLSVVDQDNAILYWPKQLASTAAREALEGYLNRGNIDPQFVIRALPVPVEGWRLVSIVNAKQFFEPIDQQVRALLLISLGAAVVILLLTLLALRPITSAFKNEERLLVLAQTDRLTGLSNHVRMQELITAELTRADRYAHPVVLIMFDIDHFKALNDQYGHPAGDAVLVDLAALCRGMVRESDHLARYGGEEFMVILPETHHANGLVFAERLRQTIETKPFKIRAIERHITVSVGVVSWSGQPPSPSKHDLINRVDQALYRSKAEGRNRVTDAGSLVPNNGHGRSPPDGDPGAAARQ